MSGEGVLVRVTMKAIARGTSSLSIQNAVLRDVNGALLSPQAVTFGAELFALAPDFNGDGVVDTVDVLIILGRTGHAIGDPLYECQFDLNADGVIDTGDILLILGLVGTLAPTAQ